MNPHCFRRLLALLLNKCCPITSRHWLCPAILLVAFAYPVASSAQRPRAAMTPFSVASARGVADGVTGRMQGTASLSSAARALLQARDKHRAPHPPLLRGLTLSDKPELLRQFRRLPLSERVSVTWALAYLGGADVSAALVEALQRGYKHGSMAGGDLQGLAAIVHALGFLAIDDDVAFDFLRQHAAPEQWAKVRKWRDYDATWDQDAELAILCIGGLGLSGRPEGQVLVAEIVEWDWSVRKRIYSGVTGAHSWLWLKQQQPDPKELMMVWISDGWLEKMVEWYETQEGVLWHQWRKQQIEALRLESQPSPLK
jgi:hypothetical protein